MCIIMNEDDAQPDVLALPSLPLFSGSLNLEEFDWYLDFTSMFGTDLVGSLDNFVFPNLATFKLTAFPSGSIAASDLLDFLKASPTLRTVEVRIDGDMIPPDIPRDTVVLSNVETFSLHSVDNMWHVYESAIHVSCPRAKYTSLINAISDDQMRYGQDVFPDPASWNTIVRQYTASPVEEVTLEITSARPGIDTAFSLAFQSPDATVIRLGFEVFGSGRGGLELSHEEVDLEIFTQACRTIRSHPLLSYVRRLRIKDVTGVLGLGSTQAMAEVVEELFGSLGPLDELIIHGCDLEMFLAPFIENPALQSLERVFPPVKELTISEPLIMDEQRCADGLVELVKSQHELGKPFERLTVRAERISTTTEEMLREWVGVLDCHEL